jgi:hypothetical protein
MHFLLFNTRRAVSWRAPVRHGLGAQVRYLAAEATPLLTRISTFIRLGLTTFVHCVHESFQLNEEILAGLKSGILQKGRGWP